MFTYLPSVLVTSDSHSFSTESLQRKMSSNDNGKVVGERCRYC
jgi:hypothetical protein